jgi:tRNA G46 methylase TrmB
LCQHPESKVIGVEISEGMINAAKYKFHQDSGKELLAHVDNAPLLSYWEQFRQESLPYKDRVQFIKGDVQEEKLLPTESIDGAVANQGHSPKSE